MAKAKHKSPIKVPGWIKTVAKLLEALSPLLAAKFGMWLFTRPVKFKLPKREHPMNANSTQQKIHITTINKTINVYSLGNSTKKVLLVHGWSGRGTQLYAIAENLANSGFETISFDAPAHGKSSGSHSDMTEFIASILQLEKQFGPFDYAVGHSLGAMAVLNAVKLGLDVKKAVIIGSGDVIEDIMLYFTNKLGMKIATGRLMIQRFENKFGQTINSYSAYIAAQHVKIPVLVFHDENDTDVPVSAAHHIHKHLQQGELIITKGLGHRKILGDKVVIKTILEFLKP
ncbi:MAG: alpha/beta hydrolase [Bacteroidota bacterium]